MVHAASVPLRSRSHFDAQDNLENGLRERLGIAATGWLNRLLMALPAGASGQDGRWHPDRRSAADHARTCTGSRLVSHQVSGSVLDPTLSQVRAVQARDAEMYRCAERGLAANAIGRQPGARTRRDQALAQGFSWSRTAVCGGRRSADRSAFAVNWFDTHANQGGTQGQSCRSSCPISIRRIGDFKLNVGSAWAETAMVFATEFGRNMRINGGKGTDHGVGTRSLACRRSGEGRQSDLAIGQGLAPSQLYEGERPQAHHRSALGVQGCLAGSPRRFRHHARHERLPGKREGRPLANLSEDRDRCCRRAFPGPVRTSSPIAKLSSARKVRRDSAQPRVESVRTAEAFPIIRFPLRPCRRSA